MFQCCEDARVVSFLIFFNCDVDRLIRSVVYCVSPGGTVAPLTLLLCQPVTDWLHAPDHTGVVWGLSACSWRGPNTSVPNLQDAHFETAHMWPLERSRLFDHPFTICSLHLKAISWTASASTWRSGWTVSPLLLDFHWLPPGGKKTPPPHYVMP